MNYDTAHLQRCRQLIEEKLGWPPAGQWRDFEFTDLSDKIFGVTGVQLSSTTLKRVFGKVRYESLPSSATLNALAGYLGCENWMQFKSSGPGQPVTTRNPPGIPARRKWPLKSNAVLSAAAVLALVIVFGFVFLSGPGSSSAVPRDVIFKSRPLAAGLPNSVVFNVDLKGIRSDDIVIQQSWDSTRTIRLKPGQTEATGIYYDPGYFRAKLIVDKKVIKEHDLFIRSDEWMATIDHEPVPTYVKKEDILQTNGLTISPAVLGQLKKTERPVTLTYHLVKPFAGLQSDNFSLETSFQNDWSEGPAVCKTTKIFILCSNAAFIIPFSIPGCVSDINLKLADRTWEGKSNDLSAFGIDPAQKNKLRFEVKDRHVKIILNGKLLREEQYNKDAGEVVGLRYSFLGAGTVGYVVLENKKGDVVYRNTFRGK
jgi:hypothetical protein